MTRLATLIVSVVVGVLSLGGVASGHLLPCVHHDDAVTCIAVVGPHEHFTANVTLTHNATCEALIGSDGLDLPSVQPGANHVVYQANRVRVDLRQTGWRRFHISVRSKRRRIVTVILGAETLTPFKL